MSKRKDGKGKKPPKKPLALKMDTSGVDGKRAARNVAFIREKISKALDDPNKREGIVRAMRSMLNEEKT